ncbi:hypothetical protein [Pseudonocardia oroxyli]|uniref:Core-binding (CB) domain-containing protein n=1 Tax=Pseudonocardia oroxyli TaxID=366584 RepID=A0A1G7XSK3_PSEOR|nr:hypothetical protein [Pseudonocardia oroxyli]SDG86993.1 hypothetical protein SAMN05216377_11670 [Pseudonocardia oroxyli]
MAVSTRPNAAQLSAALGPFVAWLASREPNEIVRVRHRRLVEDYLRWASADSGAPGDRRTRYERLFEEPTLSWVRSALDVFAEHRAIRAATRIE